MKKESENPDTANRAVRTGGNFLYLFSGLLLTLLMLPFMDDMSYRGQYSLPLLFSLFMLISMWSMSTSRPVFRMTVVLAVAICIIAGLDAYEGDKRLEAIGLLLILLFTCLGCYIAARNVFVWHRADPNSLLGAFCVYLQIGLIWAVLYRLLRLCSLAEFAGNLNDEAGHEFPALVYFSFVTLASLGYGDITPVSGLARAFAYLEAVTGQFYLAVMVSSLVGAFISRRSQGENRGSNR